MACNGPGKKLYQKLLRVFKQGYLSIALYKNVHENRIFYDTVIYRKVGIKLNGEPDWRRGASLKPFDIIDLQELLVDVKQFLDVIPDMDPNDIKLLDRK